MSLSLPTKGTRTTNRAPGWHRIAVTPRCTEADEIVLLIVNEPPSRGNACGLPVARAAVRLPVLKLEYPASSD